MYRNFRLPVSLAFGFGETEPSVNEHEETRLLARRVIPAPSRVMFVRGRGRMMPCSANKVWECTYLKPSFPAFEQVKGIIVIIHAMVIMSTIVIIHTSHLAHVSSR